MIEALSIGLTGFASLLACYAALYLGASVISPRFFLDDLCLNDERFRKLSDSPSREPTFRWTYYVGSGALIVGLLILMFHAANALTMWIPSSWMEIGEDGEHRWVGWSAQLIIGFFFFAVIADALTKLEANAHSRLKPARWRISSRARRGYERAEALITETDGARRSEIDLKPSHSAMEFIKGFDIRLAEAGDGDAQAGRYRSAAFEDRESYLEAWSEAVSRLRASGWSHLRMDEILRELEASRAAEATARDKEYWRSALGFDPDEVLRGS